MDADTTSFLADIRRRVESTSRDVDSNLKLDALDSHARARFVEAQRNALADLLACCGVVERRAK